MKPIVTGPTTKVLRARSEEVENPRGNDIRKLIRDMRETLAATPHGIGLAAPQIGVNKRVFIVHPEVAKENGISDVFINPVIMDRSKKELELEEGCLSIPEIFGMVKRAKRLKVETLDETGTQITIKAEKLLAHIIQHETDHLNGVLFVDRAKELFTVTPKKE